MFARMLVPLDGSPLAEGIMPEVAEPARIHGAEVMLLRVALAHTFPGVDATDAQVHAVSHNPHPPLEQLREEMIREAGQALQRRVRRKLRFLPRAKSMVVAGPPFRQIIRYAGEHHVDLIVMGTQGLTGLDRLIMGSTAERIVRTAPCPVVSIRAAA
jgi:nucleotide-binding universal stress UspA family protein